MKKDIPVALILFVCTMTNWAATTSQCGCNQNCDLTTDRPDTTEAALTVPCGSWQVESTAFGYSRDTSEGIRTETFTVGGINLKYGVGPRTDLQLVFDSFTEERVIGRGVHETVSGFSDVTLRLKQNLRGNDEEGGIAWALMPYVKIPTGTALSNSEWEGGLIVPFGYEISQLLTVNWMVEADAAYNAEKSKHEAVLVHSISLAWKLSEPLGLFTEFVGETGGGPYRAYANAGFTYGLTANLQFDVAVNFGLTEPATDLACFGGISYRF